MPEGCEFISALHLLKLDYEAKCCTASPDITEGSLFDSGLRPRLQNCPKEPQDPLFENLVP